MHFLQFQTFERWPEGIRRERSSDGGLGQIFHHSQNAPPRFIWVVKSIKIHIRQWHPGQLTIMRQTSLCSFCRAIWLLPPTFVILDGLCLSSILGWFSCPLIGASQMDLKKPFMITNDHYKSWWLAFFFSANVFCLLEICLHWLGKRLIEKTTSSTDNLPQW